MSNNKYNPSDGLMSKEVNFRKYHNFKRIHFYNEKIPSLSKPTNPNVGKWWCDKCDSVVQFPKQMSDNDVNRVIHIAGKFKCIEPVIKYQTN